MPEDNGFLFVFLLFCEPAPVFACAGADRHTTERLFAIGIEVEAAVKSGRSDLLRRAWTWKVKV